MTVAESWKFEPRPSVDPAASRSEWSWIIDRVKDQGWTGKVWVRREVELMGESSITTFTIHPGQTKETNRDQRNF